MNLRDKLAGCGLHMALGDAGGLGKIAGTTFRFGIDMPDLNKGNIDL